LTFDPVSGFMVSNRSDRITPEQKLLIVEYYREKGNLHEACRVAAVAPRSLRQARDADPQLNAMLSECERGFVEKAKGYMLEHMARPGNYMDRVTIARRFEPGVWGDNPRLQVDVNITQVTDAIRKAESIDAELLETDSKDALKLNGGERQKENGL